MTFRYIRYIRITFRSLVDFFRDGGMMLAGSLSYFTVMAIVPFCLFLVALFGSFLGEHREFYQFFLSKLISFFPESTHVITEELRKIITYKGLGEFTLILYGLLSYQLFSSMESAINTIFKTKGRRPFIISLILSLIMITSLIVFLFLSFGAASAISMLETLRGLSPGLEIDRITGFLIGVAVPLILIFFVATTLYILLPRKRVKVVHALSGALFTAIFLEIAKHLFTFYVGKVVRLGTIYGPLSAFVIFLLWVYYSSCIFLIGAEMVRNLGLTRER